LNDEIKKNSKKKPRHKKNKRIRVKSDIKIKSNQIIRGEIKKNNNKK